VARLGGFQAFGGLGNADLNSEHFLNELCYGGIRNIVNLYIQSKPADIKKTANDAVNHLKRIGLLDHLSTLDSKVLTPLEAMTFCYLDTIKEWLSDKDVKKALKAIQEKFNL
jgi:hypothetical protein